MTAKKNKPVETDVDIKKNSELFLEIFCKENEKLEKLIRKRNTAK